MHAVYDISSFGHILAFGHSTIIETLKLAYLQNLNLAVQIITPP